MSGLALPVARPSGGDAGAVLKVLGSCLSLQIGATCGVRLFPLIGSSGTSLLRLGSAALVLVLATRPAVRHWSGGQWRSVLALGLAMAGMNGFFYAAIARIPLGAAVTIEFLGPLLLAALLSRRRRDLIWVALAAAGVVLLGVSRGRSGSGLDALGTGYALAAGLFWALYILAARRVGARMPGQAGLAGAMTIAALVLLPLGLSGAATAVTRPEVLFLGLVTGVLASVLPYAFEMSALRHLDPSVFGVLLSLEPAIGAVAGRVLLGQRFGPGEALAVAVVVLASAGSTLSAAAQSSRRGSSSRKPAPTESDAIASGAPGVRSPRVRSEPVVSQFL